MNKVYLSLVYNKQNAQFDFDYSEKLIQFNDKVFEFKSVSKKDNFELILKYTKNNSDYVYDLSKKVFPLEEITTQDEYGVQITLLEEKDPDQVVAFINSKITLHWSDYKFFMEKMKNSEIRIRKLNEAANKVNQYISQINEIYHLSPKFNNKTSINLTNENTQTGLGQMNQFDSAFSSDRHPKDNPKEKIEINNEEENGNKEEEIIDYNDISEKKTFNRNSYKNLNAIPLLKLLSLLCILFAFLNSLQRPDYFSALIGIISFGYIFFVERKNFAIKSKNFWYLFLLVFCGFIYDCIWLCINLDLLETDIDYKGPFHNAIAKISFFTNGLGGINKCCLAILIFAQYKLNY